MTEKKAQEGEIVSQELDSKNRKGPLFWIALTGLGCLLLLCCACSVFTGLMVTSEDFQEDFKEDYCEEIETDNIEDPFGWCE